MGYTPLTLGSTPNDGTGEGLRSGGVKLNTMLSELYTGPTLSGTLTAGGFVTTGAVSSGTLATTGNASVGGTLIVAGQLAVSAACDFSNFVNMHAGCRINGLSPYADNAAAIAAGHVNGDVYVNSTVGALMVVVGAP